MQPNIGKLLNAREKLSHHVRTCLPVVVQLTVLDLKELQKQPHIGVGPILEGHDQKDNPWKSRIPGGIWTQDFLSQMLLPLSLWKLLKRKLNSIVKLHNKLPVCLPVYSWFSCTQARMSQWVKRPQGPLQERNYRVTFLLQHDNTVYMWCVECKLDPSHFPRLGSGNETGRISNV